MPDQLESAVVAVTLSAAIVVVVIVLYVTYRVYKNRLAGVEEVKPDQ